MNMVTSIFKYVLLIILYHPKGYSVIVFNDVETSVAPPFYIHQTFCVMYNKHFDLLRSNSELDMKHLYDSQAHNVDI